MALEPETKSTHLARPMHYVTRHSPSRDMTRSTRHHLRRHMRSLSLVYQAVPAVADVPDDEAALRHFPLDPSAAVWHAISHGGWMMVKGLMVTSTTTTLPGSMSDSMETAAEESGGT